MQEPENTPGNSVTSRSVLEFLTVANDFCSFLEKSEDFQKSGILTYLQRVLPLIYIKASLLPDIQPEDENAIEHYVTEQEWEELFNQLRAKFGDDDIFHYIDLHEHSHQDPVRASLAETVTDLYQDLKDFVLLYQNPLTPFRENAVAECRRLFGDRFGFRIVRAHTAIHYLLYQSDTDSPLPEFFPSDEN